MPAVYIFNCLYLRFIKTLDNSSASTTTAVDNAVSDAIKLSKQISLTKNISFPEKNIETTIVASEFDDENGQVFSTSRIWPEVGYFNNQLTDFNMKKVNYPDNLVIYVNQAYLTVQNSKKMFYVNFYLIGQIIEALNPPENIANYLCKDCEVKIYKPRYDVSTVQFLGLYKTISYLVVRGDEEEHFLNYGFCKQKSKSTHIINIEYRILLVV